MEPQIKAKLVIDTSQLNGLSNAQGSTGTGGLGKGSTESTKILKDIKTGLKPVSDFSKLSLANLLKGGPAVAVAAIVGGITAGLSYLKDQDSDATSGIIGKASAMFGNDNIKESLGKYIEELEKQAADLEEQGMEGDALALREKIKSVRQIYDNMVSETKKLNSETKEATGIMGFVNAGMSLVNGDLKKVDTELNKNEGVIEGVGTMGMMMPELVDEQGKWKSNIEVINEKLQKYKDSIPDFYGNVRVDPNAGIPEEYANTSSGTAWDYFQEQNRQSILPSSGLGGGDEES